MDGCFGEGSLSCWMGFKFQQDQLMQKSKTQLLETVGGGDIRIQTLWTPEHCGPVGSSAKFVPSAKYSNFSKAQAQFKDITTERRLAYLESTVQALAERQNNTLGRHYDVSSSMLPPKDHMDYRISEAPDQYCQLAVGSKENVVAAKTILEHATPNDESLFQIKDTANHQVDWPEDLGVRTLQTVANFQHGKRKREFHTTIEVFSKLVDRCVTRDATIILNHEEDPYGNQCPTFVTAEDCRIMIAMTELTVSCINAYIRILYEQLKDDGLLGQFAFINPTSVSLAGGPDNAKRRDERAQAVASFLQKATGTRFIFMPYNPGFHWILVVIDMETMTSYYLDSLRGFVNIDLKNIVKTGLIIYHSQNTSQSNHVNEQWKIVQVPVQEDNVKCGYYVLRFMKDIVANIRLLTENFYRKETYTEAEIDEVRCEWTAFVARYI
ncbi:hypothetical protein ACOSQ4_009108 [Xanthoceras sorbifolium]